MATLSRRSQTPQGHNSTSLATGAPRTASHAAAADPLQPLRAMADRVGKEVEQFAERLDHWHTQSTENEKAKHRATAKIIGNFRDIAETNVRELKKHNEAAHEGELHKSMQRRIKNVAPEPGPNHERLLGRITQSAESSTETATPSDPTSIQELRDWQAELATWELVRVIFDHHHPEPGTNREAERKKKLAKAGGTHRYCPKNEVWERFIIEDDAAREKKIILKWLQQTSKNSESKVESIIDQWGKESGKDPKTWTSGWLDTKARIKQTKRMHGTDGPLSPDVTIQGNDAQKPLTTQLDPDAPMRQKRFVDKSDEYYENALWMVCYEMIRRGEPWDKISDWCKERNEAWRAVSIGASSEPRADGAPNMSGKDFGYLFRRMCLLAGTGARFPYEGAVYALIAGDYQRIPAISQSWDDQLYVFYNALLLARFDNFLLADVKAPPRAQKLGPRFNFPDVMQYLNCGWENATQEVLELLKQDKITSEQAKTPMKLIQSALIGGTLDELVHKVGIAIADSFQTDSRGWTVIIDPEADVMKYDAFVKDNKTERSVVAEHYYRGFMQDPRALRILVHVFIILGNPRDPLTREQAPKLFARGNVIATYIEMLGVTKRLQLTPLYVAHLERWRATMSLGRILPKISNEDERNRYIQLMEQYQLDVTSAMRNCYYFLMDNTGLVEEAHQETLTIPNRISKYKVLERSALAEAYLWPRGQHISDTMHGLDVSKEEQALVDLFIWRTHADKGEDCLFKELQLALSTFMLAGRMGAAQKLATEVSVETVSLTRTPAYCDYAFDFTMPGAEEQDAEQVSQHMRESLRSSGRGLLRPSQVPSPQHHAAQVHRLRKVCQPYHDCSQLVRIIWLFQQWRKEEQKLTTMRSAVNKSDSTYNIKDLLRDIQSVFASIMDPFYDPRIDSVVWDMYKAYMPDITLAYLAVLQAGSFFVHRDTAVKAMDLAVMVADEEKDWLQAVFVETKRMRELVDAIADVSKAMLDLGEHGDTKSRSTFGRKRGNKGETLRIWDMNVQN